MSEIKDKEPWHGHTNAEVENYIKNRLDNSAGYHKILYAELKELRDNNKLVPGMQYRITDYKCTTTQENTKSAEHQFDIIVTADDESTLNETARAIKHDGDEYFANSNLNAWKIWYCLDNDNNRFAWADATNGKGIIYRMIDEWNNDVPYDFKNIQFKYPNDTTTYPYYYYTFASSNEENNTDYSLDIVNKCYSNTIKMASTKGINDLNYIICIDAYVQQNYFGIGCRNIILNRNCYNNTFGNSCMCNIFGKNSYSNTFGNGCSHNTFGEYFNNNTFGDNCSYVKLSSTSSAEIPYNYYRYNHFGDGCQYILFKGTEKASLAAAVQYYNFTEGLRGTSSVYITIDGKRNRSYETYISKDTDGTIKESLIAEKIDKIIKISYDDLVTLRGSSKLVPGQQYRITDYTCTTTQADTQSAGHQFDIIVTADDKSTLNEEARAILHIGDEYFSGCNLSAWKI